jgi:hypothetical protein
MKESNLSPMIPHTEYVESFYRIRVPTPSPAPHPSETNKKPSAQELQRDSFQGGSRMIKLQRKQHKKKIEEGRKDNGSDGGCDVCCSSNLLFGCYCNKVQHLGNLKNFDVTIYPKDLL